MALRQRDMIVSLEDSEHGPAGEHRVTIKLGDQLRAELEGKRHGMDAVKMPIHLQGLFGWAALVREGVFTGKWADFTKVCLFVEDADDDTADDVDPTQTAASSA